MFKTVSSLFLAAFCVLAMIISTSVSAAVVDGKPSISSPGVYIWRDSGNNWHYRMVSGATQATFDGALKATAPFSYIQNNSIEANDFLEQTWPALVKMKLQQSNWGRDGFEFSVPEGKGICLKGSGSFGSKVYVGAGNTQMNTPIDLTSNGACGNNTTSASLKYHPGHYVALNPHDDQTRMINTISPGVVGMLIRYPWIDLEPSYGKYNFAKIASDLQIAADHGMRLVVMIEDKTFQSIKYTPSYLWNNGNTLPHKNSGGYVAARWKPYVVDRLNALVRAMGNRFDSHPSFEGVAFQESAMGLPDWVKNQQKYTPEKYRDAIIDMLLNARESFPTSQVFWYMNFLEGKQAYIETIANTIAPHNIAMGGPDVLKENASLEKMAYPYYEQFKDKMTLFGSMQYDSYKEKRSAGVPTTFYPMWELFQFARDTLHVNYVFWTREPKRDFAESYQYTDAVPVIGNNPYFNR